MDGFRYHCPSTQTERAMRRYAVFMFLASLAGTTAVAKTPADTFVVAANMSQMITLDPAAINESFAGGIVRQSCDALISLDPDDASKLIPGVAESWTVSPDGGKFTIKI